MGPDILRQAGVKEKLEAVGCGVVDYGDLEFRLIKNDNFPDERTHNSRSVGAAAKKVGWILYVAVLWSFELHFSCCHQFEF